MTNLERFNKIVNFEKVDRPLKWETLGFWGETLQKWNREDRVPLNTDLMDYYGLDPRPVVPGLCDLTAIPYNPHFEERVIEENETTRIKQNWQGVMFKEFKNSSAMPQWLEFPVKKQKDWENIKFRLNPANHDFGDFDETKYNFLTNPDPNGLQMCGLYGWYRNFFGEINLAYAFYDCPRVIHDMGRHWVKFYGEVAGRMISETRTDYVLFWEDMAYKNGPLIGPDLFKEFMVPYYKKLVSHFKGLGIKTFVVDSDGNNDILLPLFLDIGINMMLPFEVAADNDVRDIRERYSNLVIWGGIDKRYLEGTKEEIKKEVMEKVPVMWEKGGYIPCLDHSTPPVPKENWEYYLELVRSIFK